jgi:cytochrome c oxidase subunit 4
MKVRQREVLHAHPGPAEYVKIAVILAIVTAAEVAVYYVPSLQRALVPILLAMATVKFAMVVMWFMHLRFDSRLFTGLFVTGMILAGGVFSVLLVTLARR